MSGIGSVAPAVAGLPVEQHQALDRDERKPPRRPRRDQSGRDQSDSEMVEAEPHKLDLEA